MARVFLGLGANVGNRRANLLLALRWLAPQCPVAAVSSLYRSDAVVTEGEPPGPDYLNAACEASTTLSAGELLRLVKDIEYGIGRRPAPLWSPRPIDIDILLYGDLLLDEPDLCIPHPLMAARAFVMMPLRELAPAVRHPLLARTIGDLARELDPCGVDVLSGPEWAAEVLAGSADRPASSR